MTIKLYHHPQTRARHVVWMLEEIEQPYELIAVDMLGGGQQTAEHTARNRMQKVPVLVDDGEPISECSAIGMYLADRYAPGRLAPALDAKNRGTYLRWCVFGPSVVEPACMAKAANWAFQPAQAGFGTYENVLATLEGALEKGPWLLGEDFSMADVLLGGTIRWMVGFKMLDARERFTAYIDRLNSRPALQRSEAKNKAAMEALSA